MSHVRAGSLVKATGLLPEAPRVAPGACIVCRSALGAFSPIRGRDGRIDEDTFFTDRFCSRGCFHAYGRWASGPARVAAWN